LLASPLIIFIDGCSLLDHYHEFLLHSEIVNLLPSATIVKPAHAFFPFVSRQSLDPLAFSLAPSTPIRADASSALFLLPKALDEDAAVKKKERKEFKYEQLSTDPCFLDTHCLWCT
jgi:hypothetical protein